MTKTILRKREKPKLSDLTPKDIYLLGIAHGLSDEQFLCFGSSFYRLESLGLISEENQITFAGRMHLHELSLEERRKKAK